VAGGENAAARVTDGTGTKNTPTVLFVVVWSSCDQYAPYAARLAAVVAVRLGDVVLIVSNVPAVTP
jgi:hypothetical protein